MAARGGRARDAGGRADRAVAARLVRLGLVFGVAFFFPLLAWVVNVAWYAWAALAPSLAVIFAVLAWASGCC